ncbi:MAG: YgiT-type zinc finger protein [Chloroflexi bacterium]|nr:YgiT-type zinc finger protein [Chloroflexota bacterium]MBP8056520.1 YgiT-type zinc finger protein [Chloroflexota bacterium]
MNVCPNCSVGRLHEARVSYLAELDGYQVMIPYVPSVVCDVCGRIEYDLEYMHLLENLTRQPAITATKQPPVVRPYPRPAVNPQQP